MTKLYSTRFMIQIKMLRILDYSNFNKIVWYAVRHPLKKILDQQIRFMSEVIKDD
jgi:hypothetical protein